MKLIDSLREAAKKEGDNGVEDHLRRVEVCQEVQG